MTSWDDATIIADSASLAAGTPAAAGTPVEDYHTPEVCVSLENLEGNADDTLTIEFDGAAATYQADQRTLSSTQTYTVTLPQCDDVQVTSSNGVTYSIEVRNNPR